MTTASNSAPSIIDNTWLNQDCAQRLVTLGKLDPADPINAAFFIKIAQQDEHEPVRLSAITRILEFDALVKIQQFGAKEKESAQQQIYRIIAGTVEGKHSEPERIDKLKQLPLAGIKQVALITKLKTIGSLAVDAVTMNEDLADLCLFAGSVHVRKAAVGKIKDTQLLKDILTRIAGKDKTVSKIITARLETETESAPTPTHAKEDGAAESQANDRSKVTKKTSPNKQTPKPKAPQQDPGTEFESIKKESEKLSFKNTARLFEIRSQLRKLKARLSESEIELSDKIIVVQNELEDKISKNNEYQERLKEKTEELLANLATALEEGKSEAATQCWDKIQGNISNTANQIRAQLQNKANTHKEKITELRDWKIFAATEKKKELIVQMQHLLESKMHAADRSKSISKMHKEWKALGRSNQNEQLWNEFKTLSDQAYEPCKEYFKQRKQLMTDNLLKRRELCESLETELKLLQDSDDDVDVSMLNKLLNKADKDWKLHAPIEQSKIKSLQKRFYETINQLRKMRKSNLNNYAKQKQTLVEKAQALTKLEDHKQAMSEAKRLQQEWKKVGPTTYREDNKFWQDFRAACDAIFAKRNQAEGEQRADLNKVESRLNQILTLLQGISQKNDADFRESRSEYQDLAQEFSNSLDPRIKSQRKRLLDQFNSVKRQIDSRFRTLPDKRQLLAQQRILERTTMLQNLELSLMAESDSEKFSSQQQTFDLKCWDGIEKSGNSDIDELLQTRLQSAISVKSSSELAKLCKQCEQQYRELCIHAEIRANTDSPVEDKPLRMKLQLEQLQSGFGQAKPDPKQNLKYAMNIELQSCAMGPLDEVTREKLAARLAQILRKLR
ncbi:MAG: DUF349 domain-containing protein [Pseudohongiellaceae bacterium]